MRALYLDKTLTLREDYAAPTPPPGEALVRVRLAGVCNTDLELVRGYMSFRGVPGHEFVGEVVQCDSAPEWIGQRVVGEINAACGQCETCRAGRPTHCPHRTTLGIAGRDGAFAEYLCLPIANLHRVPENVPDEAAVFVEPLAAACEITQAVHIRPTDRVVVLGDGKLGLLCAQVLQLTGCDLLVIGHHEESLGILAKRGIRTRQDLTGPEDLSVYSTSSSKPPARRKDLPRRANSCARAEPSCSSPRITARWTRTSPWSWWTKSHWSARAAARSSRRCGCWRKTSWR